MMEKEAKRDIVIDKEMEEKIELLGAFRYTREQAMEIISTPGMFEKIAHELYEKFVAHPRRYMREQEAKGLVEGIYISY